MRHVDATYRDTSDESNQTILDVFSPEARKYLADITFEIIFEADIPMGVRTRWISKDRPDSLTLCPDLFKKSYRNLECSKCHEIFLAHHFEWKVKGFEGPFSSVWGKRHTHCKNCRKAYKARLYKKKKNLIKQLEKFQVTHVGSPDPVAFLTPFSILLEDA